MGKLFIAYNNPPFKNEGFDKPLFFNAKWARDNGWSETDTIKRCKEKFDETYFSAKHDFGGNIFEMPSWNTLNFKLESDNPNIVFNTSFIKVRLDDETYDRYYWITSEDKVSSGVNQYNCELDTWITYIDTIRFNDRKAEVKRSMPDRYLKVSDTVNAIDNQSAGNLSVDGFESATTFTGSIMNLTKFSEYIPPIAPDWTLLGLFGNEKQERKKGFWAYAIINTNETNIGNDKATFLPQGGTIIPLWPDDLTVGEENNVNSIPPISTGTAWLDQALTINSGNYYHNAANLPEQNVIGIFYAPIPPISDGTLLNATNIELVSVGEGDALKTFYGYTTKGVNAWLNTFTQNDGYYFNDILKDQSIFSWDFLEGKIGDLAIHENEPINYHSQLNTISINNAFGQGGQRLGLELFNHEDNTNGVFNHNYRFTPIGQILTLTPKNKNGFFAGMNNGFDISIHLDTQIASSSQAWKNYEAQYKNTFNAGLDRAFVEAGVSITGGLAAGALGGATVAGPVGAFIGGAIGLIAASWNSSKKVGDLQRQRKDLKAQAMSQNPAKLLTESIFTKAQQVDDYDRLWGEISYDTADASLTTQIINHYRLYGYGYEHLEAFSFSKLQVREYWNVWSVDNINYSIKPQTTNVWIRQYFDDIFSRGVRLWTTWDNDAHVYNWDLENWETSLKLNV